MRENQDTAQSVASEDQPRERRETRLTEIGLVRSDRYHGCYAALSAGYGMEAATRIVHIQRITAMDRAIHITDCSIR